jgi:acyl carrier protein
MSKLSLESLEHALIACLQEVQDLSGAESTVITTDTCPIKDLPGFDSLRSVEATVYLCTKLQIKIDAPQGEVNLFVSKDGRRPLRVKDIRERILTLRT